MTDVLDLIGRHFGDLAVLQRIRKQVPGRYKRALWLCECACGTTPIVQQEALLDGSVTACATCLHTAALRRQSRRALVDAATTNVCAQCQGDPQPLSAFPAGTSRYGTGAYCRRCVAARTATYKARIKATR